MWKIFVDGVDNRMFFLVFYKGIVVLYEGISSYYCRKKSFVYI